MKKWIPTSSKLSRWSIHSAFIWLGFNFDTDLPIKICLSSFPFGISCPAVANCQSTFCNLLFHSRPPRASHDLFPNSAIVCQSFCPSSVFQRGSRNRSNALWFFMIHPFHSLHSRFLFARGSHNIRIKKITQPHGRKFSCWVCHNFLRSGLLPTFIFYESSAAASARPFPSCDPSFKLGYYFQRLPFLKGLR